ncbi:hypothetical protein [Rhodopirellula sp. SWK7]|uniref:hypothetical protein n=1 Tax=Rhodopirellula sp. SWK7 TaxID=595460 RepID=UPI0005C4E442|nr:hypothetical protein [Rhodopirellula sp. SWK7]
MRAEVKWTNLSRLQIAKRIADLGTPVSKNIVNKPVYIALAFALLQPYVAPGFSTSSLLEAGVVVRREMWPEFSRTMLVAAKVMLAIGSTSAILVPLDPNRVSPMSSLVNNRVSVRHLQLRTFQNILDCIVQSAAGIFRHH